MYMNQMDFLNELNSKKDTKMQQISIFSDQFNAPEDDYFQFREFCNSSGLVMEEQKSDWVDFAHIIDWHRHEEEYQNIFSIPDTGRPTIPFRVVMGTLIIKELLNLKDKELLSAIMESPELQYFLGLITYTKILPIGLTSLSTIRKQMFAEKNHKGYYKTDKVKELIQEYEKNGVKLPTTYNRT